MALYTFIMSYRGGTYIAQVNAATLQKAKQKWLAVLEVDAVKHLGVKMKEELDKEITNDSNIAINNTTNVWINCASIKGGFVIVHIIKTEK